MTPFEKIHAHLPDLSLPEDPEDQHKKHKDTYKEVVLIQAVKNVKIIVEDFSFYPCI